MLCTGVYDTTGTANDVLVLVSANIQKKDTAFNKEQQVPQRRYDIESAIHTTGCEQKDFTGKTKDVAINYCARRQLHVQIC